MWTCHRRRVEMSIKKCQLAGQTEKNTHRETQNANRRCRVGDRGWGIEDGGRREDGGKSPLTLQLTQKLQLRLWTPTPTLNPKTLTFGVACLDH